MNGARLCVCTKCAQFYVWSIKDDVKSIFRLAIPNQTSLSFLIRPINQKQKKAATFNFVAVVSILQDLKMHSAICIIIFVIGIVIILNANERNQLPCKYLDSINITDGIRQADDSIELNGMVFTKDQYAHIDFVLENGVTHQIVPPYMRGCVCRMKSCVRLCCPLGSFYQNRSCHRHNNHVQRLEATVLDEHKHTKTIILDNHFAYVNDRSCRQRYIADEYQMIYVRIDFECKQVRFLFVSNN